MLCVLLLIVVSSFGFRQPGLECAPLPSVRVSVKQSTAVFTGEVVSEEYRDVNTDSAGQPKPAQALVVKLKVTRWWKGDAREEVYLYTSVRKYPDGSSSVMAEDFQFRKGESYLVYAFSRDGHLVTSGCSRTRKLAEAEEDLRELGEGKLPDKKGMALLLTRQPRLETSHVSVRAGVKTL